MFKLIFNTIYRFRDNLKIKKGERKMATQIMATPPVRGAQAKKLLQDMKKLPSIKSEIGAQKIKEMFEKKK